MTDEKKYPYVEIIGGCFPRYGDGPDYPFAATLRTGDNHTEGQSMYAYSLPRARRLARQMLKDHQAVMALRKIREEVRL